MMQDSDFQFPPYTHIPGQTPHPISDPRGHSYQSEAAAAMTSEQTLQWALALFERGYYWEAHEAWEQVWIELGRCGKEADAVKGLIKLAAAGVKCLERNPRGAERHFARACELLDLTNRTFGHPFVESLPEPTPLVQQIRDLIAEIQLAEPQNNPESS